MIAALLASSPNAVLDQEGRLRAMRQGFDNDGHDLTALIALLFVVVALVGLAVISIQIVRARRRGHAARGQEHGRLLPRALAALKLTRRETRDLRQVATAARLEHPVAMLLSPANLARAVALALREHDDAALRRRMEALALKLFETPLGHDSGGGPAPRAD